MITKWKVKGNFKKENDRIKIIIQNNQYYQISKYIYHIYSTNLIRGWALINFFCLYDGRLFEVGANSRLGAYSKKYGIYIYIYIQCLHVYIYLVYTHSVILVI